jgi:glycosyltransferase involved in cell wall biosynthesis
MYQSESPQMVSCVMATANRPHFFRQALRYFERQTYPNRELIVVDDGEVPVGDLCAGRDSVRYVRLEGRRETGTKLNIGVEHARGSVLHKLDDDDYYSPDFLATSVRFLPAANRERSMVARDCFLVLFAGETEVRYSGHGWTAGGTLCFYRELWTRIPFRDLSGWADSAFLQDHDPELTLVCAPEEYWLVRHGRNTWTMMGHGDTADDYLHRKPLHHRPMAAMLDPIDCAFYTGLHAARI